MALEEKQTEPGGDPGGGLWERLNASRHEIVKLCGEKGIALFSFLLTSSTIDPDQENVAIFSLQRLHDVAVQLGWSPDTVKRYVAVFRAINLVSHYHDQRREVQLRLPLGPYTPLTTFTALDELISKRKKQRQLALKVKARYIVRFGDPTLAHSDEMRQTLHEVKAILEDEHLEPLKRERLQMKIADVLTRLTGIERRHMEGDLNPLLGDLAAAPSGRRAGTSFAEGDSNQSMEAFSLGSSGTLGEEPNYKGDSNQLLGDSSAQHHIPSQPANAQMGDSNRLQGDSKSTASLKQTQEQGQAGDSNQREGDLMLSALGQQGHQVQVTGDSNQQQGDLTGQGNPQSSHKTAQLGDSNQQAVLKVGDSNEQAVVEVHANAPYTYNVNYLISNITGNNVIRKRLAQFLASVLEKNEYENGYPTFSKYLKAFKCYSPEVIGRAFLATMVLLHRKHWRVEKPGATFTDQCRILSGQMPLAHYTLDDVEEWLRAWGNLPYPELIVAIAAPAPEHPSSEPASLVTTPRQGVPTPPAHDSKKGLPGYFGANTANNNKKKRTYGMHYTGLPSGRKGFNTAGANRPPQSAEKS
jgi:hypothetical protein